MRIQRHYLIARAQSLERIREALNARAARQNAHATEHAIERGSRVWVYLDRVKHGYAPRAYGDGPFRVAELVSAYAVWLETNGTLYQLFPIMDVSKQKPVRKFLSRPEMQLTVPYCERFDFDEEFLQDDSWEPCGLCEDVYEVEQILDVREGRRVTRYGRMRRTFRIKWREYKETS
ncbi:LOW QUALITY PROTEIN: hypothetical protein PHMEG_00034837 [Phytophthora megakarya]|uniref:Chromo domain-containing protein n=1 Tax=Phytophthora megakarya TaxID=4795 RepID=A0A225URL9_9STRA|nr:LOW QUALITY PROTEIN: hypothetical protein PHMEG_00034837 [Phytophthora megakarya]